MYLALVAQLLKSRNDLQLKSFKITYIQYFQ